MAELPQGTASEKAQAVVEQLLKLASPEKLMSILGGVRQEETGPTRSAFSQRYWDRPDLFADECLRWRVGEGLAPYQREILATLPEKRRVCVRGPRGLGKSFLAAVVVHWFCLTRDKATDFKLGSTASVGRQLTAYLWPEIHKVSRQLRWEKIGRKPYNPKSELLLEKLTLHTGQAFAATATDPATLEGGHASSMAMIFDEAKSIEPAFYDSLEGCFSASEEAYALVISTPGPPVGRFFDIQSGKDGYEDWHVIHVTLDEALDAGRMNREWVEARRGQWGENSFLFQAHVLGEFCAQDEDGVIPAHFIEAAQDRWSERKGKHR